MVNEQALMNERLAEFLLEGMQDSNEAQYRYTTAIDLYEEWGARVKVDRLRKKLASIGKEPGPTIPARLRSK